jgi:predicted nucleic acid-binding protein
MPTMSTPSLTPPAVVLDTNVVLDWLVFRNPASLPLAMAIEAGQVRWICTETMRNELAHVLSRSVLDAWSPDEAGLWHTWDRLSRTVASATPPLVPRLRCTDPDDQKFIELALDQARWLVSRDRAVLKLSRRAAKLGLHILTPEQWPQHKASQPSSTTVT